MLNFTILTYYIYITSCCYFYCSFWSSSAFLWIVLLCTFDMVKLFPYLPIWVRCLFPQYTVVFLGCSLLMTILSPKQCWFGVGFGIVWGNAYHIQTWNILTSGAGSFIIYYIAATYSKKCCFGFVRSGRSLPITILSPKQYWFKTVLVQNIITSGSGSFSRSFRFGIV